ncbi:MAG TPA: hypothetical protein VGN28_06335 [Blastococcus sp.]|jgi:hypothetical protein|nr:hypothetical protein [Blastococcus sp.]
MSMLGRVKGKVTGTAKQAERGAHADGKTDRDVEAREGGTPVPPPELPLDDDGNDARNIGG